MNPGPDRTPGLAQLQPRQGVAYGLLGLPLAFVALPLYVMLPHHYAQQHGVPLATLGLVLLLARLLDAFVDPWLGRWTDRLYHRSTRHVLQGGVMASVVLALGLWALFYPQVQGTMALAVWAWALLVLATTAYSWLGIAHQSWGARLGGGEAVRGRVVAWREGAGLVGVVLASLLPVLWGLPAMLAVFVLALGLGCWAWARAPRPTLCAPDGAAAHDLWRPWQQAGFRRLYAVFVLNGIATAIPATLVLFFIQDRLLSPASDQPLFLGTYFLMAAVGMPLWLRAVQRWGLARTWLLGMVLAVLGFAWASGLQSHDRLAFWTVCALSGLALGSDLALPSALLAGVIADHGDRGRHEGAYFGWWNFAAKLNLALAAGLSLPLLAWWGYVPGQQDPAGLQALTWAYAVLPCGLKLVAGAALYLLVIRPSHRRTA